MESAFTKNRRESQQRKVQPSVMFEPLVLHTELGGSDPIPISVFITNIWINLPTSNDALVKMQM